MKRIEPGPGQESVWDYPRPPRLERCTRNVPVIFAGNKIVDTSASWRVLETSHPPVYYIPAEDVLTGVLRPTEKRSFCEWKGVARYFDIVIGDAVAANAAWGYENPTAAFAPIREHVAFYPHLMDSCHVDGERVQPQAGGFYGGWITSDIVGPFKGSPGTRGW